MVVCDPQKEYNKICRLIYYHITGLGDPKTNDYGQTVENNLSKVLFVIVTVLNPIEKFNYLDGGHQEVSAETNHYKYRCPFYQPFL